MDMAEAAADKIQSEENVLSSQQSVTPLVVSKGAESFCTWPIKERQVNMKSKKTTSKRKASPSPECDVDVDEQECEVTSPPRIKFKDSGPSSGMEIQPVFPEDNVHGHHESRRQQDLVGAARPLEGGYRLPPSDRRQPMEWADDYRYQYGPPSAGPSNTSFRRPWSPIRYDGGPDFDGRGGRYGGRGRPYDGRPDFLDRREMYYDNRGRDMDMRDGQQQDQRRYEETRYDRRAALPTDVYVRGRSPSPTQPQYTRASTRTASPRPSSSGPLVASTKEEPQCRRPLHLDNMGRPTGTMATLFHADIVAFVKDMDPTEGWERQTTTAKERLLQRLMHDYEFYGESSKLSEKYLKKQAGSALIQYRYSLNQLIDRGLGRPSDFSDDYWKVLVARRQSEEAKEKSAQMATIARGRASRNTTKRALEQSVLLELTKELKREPFEVELKQAVQKQWSALQEEAVEKKRVRAAATATAAAAQASTDLDKRLQVLESFMKQWACQLELWKGILSDLTGKKFADAIRATATTGNEVAVLPTSEDLDTANEVNEEKNTDSSDDEESMEKSNSSDEEDSSSDEENDTSDGEEDMHEQLLPTNVVEEEECVVSPLTTKKTMPLSSIPRQASSTGLQKQTTVTPVLTKGHAVEVDCPQSMGAQVQDVRPCHISDVIAKGKEDCASVEQKVADKQSRSGKKQKVAASTPAEVVMLDDESTVKSIRKPTKAMKTIKTTRKKSKSLKARPETKAAKKAK